MRPRPEAASAARSEAGYLLVEALVVLAIASLLTLFLAEGLRMGSRLLASSSSWAPEANATASVRELLRRLLAETYPALVTDRQAAGAPVFLGESDRVRFVAPLPAPLGQGVFYRIELFQRGSQLMISWLPERGQSTSGRASVAAEQHALLASRGALRLRYFGTLEDGQTGWWEQWAERRRTPTLVAVSIDGVGDGPAAWPDLIVPIRIDVSAHCIYDLFTSRCRGQ